jgi:hypothetical protein
MRRGGRWVARAFGDRRSAILLLALGLGFVVRAVGVAYNGTRDVDVWLGWGVGVDRLGLAEGYDPTPGSLFPVAYQIFGWTVGLARAFGVSATVVFKAVNLAFDTGTLVFLIAILRQWKAPIAYSLVYWLNPYFVLSSWLGYVDFHPAFFVLMSLWLLRRARSAFAIGVAGLPLGIAAAMKPQVLVLVASLGLFAVVRVVQQRRIGFDAVRAGLLLVGPAAVFVAYSAFFTAHGRSLLFLVQSYRDVGKALPALTAQMPNIWYPVADFYASGREPVTVVTEPEVFHTIAGVVTAGVIAFAVTRIARSSESRPFQLSVILSFIAGAAIFPMLMTQAHENHFFLAATLGVFLVALVRDRAFTVLVNMLLLLQAVHLFGLYGLGENRVSTALGLDQWVERVLGGLRTGVKPYALDHPGLQTLVACVTSALFFAAIARMVTRLRAQGAARQVACVPRAPSSSLVETSA